MAAVIPMLAAAAGSAGTIMTGVSLLATVVGGISEYQTGQAQQEREELNARTEELNTRREALAINEELLTTLSRNTVAAAAGGITSSGSAARAREQNKAKAAEELSINRFSGATVAADYRLSGKQAARRGTASLIGSAVDASSTGYKTYKKIKDT